MVGSLSLPDAGLEPAAEPEEALAPPIRGLLDCLPNILFRDSMFFYDLNFQNVLLYKENE